MHIQQENESEDCIITHNVTLGNIQRLITRGLPQHFLTYGNCLKGAYKRVKVENGNESDHMNQHKTSGIALNPEFDEHKSLVGTAP